MSESQALDNINYREFSSREEASTALADITGSALADRLDSGEEAHLVVSGGTSPLTFFHRLREREIAWEQVYVYPSDERVVPAGHPDRNDAMIRRELLTGHAAHAQLISLLPEDPLAPGASVEFTTPRFDAVILGMGEDGHTASLFPDSPGIEEALTASEHLVRMAVPRLDMERVSLTPAALLNASRIDMLFFGEKKREVFQHACKPGNARTYPVRAILHQHTAPICVFWAP